MRSLHCRSSGAVRLHHGSRIPTPPLFSQSIEAKGHGGDFEPIQQGGFCLNPKVLAAAGGGGEWSLPPSACKTRKNKRNITWGAFLAEKDQLFARHDNDTKSSYARKMPSASTENSGKWRSQIPKS